MLNVCYVGSLKFMEGVLLGVIINFGFREIMMLWCNLYVVIGVLLCIVRW